MVDMVNIKENTQGMGLYTYSNILFNALFFFFFLHRITFQPLKVFLSYQAVDLHGIPIPLTWHSHSIYMEFPFHLHCIPIPLRLCAWLLLKLLFSTALTHGLKLHGEFISNTNLLLVIPVVGLASQ